MAFWQRHLSVKSCNIIAPRHVHYPYFCPQQIQLWFAAKPLTIIHAGPPPPQVELPSEKIFSDFSGFYFFRKIGKWGIGKIGKIGKCNAPQLSDLLANQRTWRQKNKNNQRSIFKIMVFLCTFWFFDHKYLEPVAYINNIQYIQPCKATFGLDRVRYKGYK